jgi:hypothetical protein
VARGVQGKAFDLLTDRGDEGPAQAFLRQARCIQFEQDGLRTRLADQAGKERFERIGGRAAEEHARAGATLRVLPQAIACGAAGRIVVGTQDGAHDQLHHHATQAVLAQQGDRLRQARHRAGGTEVGAVRDADDFTDEHRVAADLFGERPAAGIFAAQ